MTFNSTVYGGKIKVSRPLKLVRLSFMSILQNKVWFCSLLDVVGVVGVVG